MTTTHHVEDRPGALLFVNPWEGIIGPNIGIRQLVSEAIARGHDVHVVCPSHDVFARQLADMGATVHVLTGVELTPRTKNPLALLTHLRRGWRLARDLAELVRKVDARSVCINSENMLLAPRAGTLAGVPVVAIMRGMRFTDLGWMGRCYFKCQRRWIDRYIAIVGLGADGLAELGVPPEKIALVRNGVDLDVFAPRERKRALAEELGIPTDVPLIGTVSHLTPRKGVHHLLQAVQRVRQSMSSVCCVVVGDAAGEADRDYADRMRNWGAAHGQQDGFRFVGYRTEIPDLLNLFDVFALPSETEACPRSAIEAQASGLPLVGFRVGGMPEILDEGVSGYLVEPFDVDGMADRLVQLLTDHALRRQMGRSARKWTQKNFDLKVNLARMLDTITGAADASGQRETLT